MKPSSFSNVIVAVVSAYAEALAESEGVNAQLQVALRGAVQAPKPEVRPPEEPKEREIEIAARRLTAAMDAFLRAGGRLMKVSDETSSEVMHAHTALRLALGERRCEP